MDKPVTLEKALETVELIDCVSQSAFAKISAIADLAVLAMESNRFRCNPEMLAALFQAMSSIADDAMNCINVEAESVGANYKDESRYRRFDAYVQSGREHGKVAAS